MDGLLTRLYQSGEPAQGGSGQGLSRREPPGAARASARPALLALALAVALAAADPAPAARQLPSPDGAVIIHLFWGEGCPHCAKAKDSLSSLAERSPWVVIRDYEVVYRPDNMALFQDVAGRLGEPAIGVPYVVVCDRAVIGWQGEATGARLETLAEHARTGPCRDVVTELTAAREASKAASAGIAPDPPIPGSAPDATWTVNLPLLGEVKARDLSLPLLTVAFAAVDGFNPCAMWALVFLMGLLLGMEDRRRMWLLGGVFLLASAGMYYAVLAAWMNVLFVLGYARWLRAAVGAVALAGGAWSLREYFTAEAGTCKVAGGGRRGRALERMRLVCREPRLWLAALGVAALGVTVNFIELVCSAGLPAVYTQVLALSQLPWWKYHAYLTLYVSVFLLDDVLVFAAAMTTLRVAGLTGRYSRASRLVGAVILLAVGLLLIFRPGWLMFG